MKLCRFGDDRLGWVQDGTVRDVTSALDSLPAVRWPLPMADPLWGNLDALRLPIEAAAMQAPPQPLATVRLLSPVPRPGKIVAVRRNRGSLSAAHPDVFLKAASAVAGPGEGVTLNRPDRDSECECELAAIIGRRTSRVGPADALTQLAGYCIALDLALTGEEDRGLRKSPDSFCVLGPWLTTADALADPTGLEIELATSAGVHQLGRASEQPFSLAQIVSYISSFLTLHPGDVILAGSPSGAVKISDSDWLDCSIAPLGRMRVAVKSARSNATSSANSRNITATLSPGSRT